MDIDFLSFLLGKTGHSKNEIEMLNTRRINYSPGSIIAVNEKMLSKLSLMYEMLQVTDLIKTEIVMVWVMTLNFTDKISLHYNWSGGRNFPSNFSKHETKT